MDEGVDTRDGGVAVRTLGAPNPGRPERPGRPGGPLAAVGPVLTVLLTAATRFDKPGKATSPPAAFAAGDWFVPAPVPHSRLVIRSSSF